MHRFSFPFRSITRTSLVLLQRFLSFSSSKSSLIRMVYDCSGSIIHTTLDIDERYDLGPEFQRHPVDGKKLSIHQGTTLLHPVSNVQILSDTTSRVGYTTDPVNHDAHSAVAILTKEADLNSYFDYVKSEQVCRETPDLINDDSGTFSTTYTPNNGDEVLETLFDTMSIVTEKSPPSPPESLEAYHKTLIRLCNQNLHKADIPSIHLTLPAVYRVRLAKYSIMNHT
ncbi:uncharacterized protein BYT42DRAFT_642301 [Radiomyces spectabilis]|uniref:uncharacterized protein n=1 Tax=Radiomyces spectabilis TaxID=64574 RepID=UPI00221E6FC0|nr:uncharacterized protein BYT42DRAFT_642301 [Radiomyces spectabilis]KAI8388015.1 hypothetical protein BYT42DRAFT_642301 [Radiomyces spectabilis]